MPEWINKSINILAALIIVGFACLFCFILWHSFQNLLLIIAIIVPSCWIAYQHMKIGIGLNEANQRKNTASVIIIMTFGAGVVFWKVIVPHFNYSDSIGHGIFLLCLVAFLMIVMLIAIAYSVADTLVARKR